MIRTVILEDEIPSQQLLSTIVNEYCPYLQLVGMAENIDVAAQLIKETKPDLVFLDIHIGHQTGFDLLDMVTEKEFKVIITTAYDEYALKAFKYEVVDYILKPYTPMDVIKSVQRIKEKLEESKVFQQLEKVIKNSIQHKGVEKLTIATSEGLKVYKLDGIIRIEGNGAYCKIFATDTQALIISKSLKEVEKMLPESQFFRTHDSHIINLAHIKEYKKEDGGLVILENNEQVPVSRRKKQDFLDKMLEFGI